MDKTEFTSFYHTYLERVYRFVFYRVGGDKETTQDLTQDIFLKAFEAFERYDPARGRSAWIYTIARNHLINHHAKLRSAVSLEEIEGTVWVSLDTRGKLVLRQDERALFAALSELATDEARLIRMKYLEGWSFDDLSEIFGKTSGALRVQAGRTLKKLRSALHHLKTL